jgi:drug/metabolite transporter (DMT)-like permease
MRSALIVLGLVIAFVAVADLAASPSVGSEETARLHTPVHVSSSNGIGEWLTLVAGILVVVGVILVGRYSRSAAPGAAGTPVVESTAPEQPVVETTAGEASIEAAPRDADAG